LELAATHLPPGRASEYNQALMDLGATVCTLRAPACFDCPLAPACKRALWASRKNARWGKRKQPSSPYCYRSGDPACGASVDHPAPQHGLLGGLGSSPAEKMEPGEDPVGCLQREICEELGVVIMVDEAFGVYRHAYTHFRVTVHAFRCTLPTETSTATASE